MYIINVNSIVFSFDSVSGLLINLKHIFIVQRKGRSAKEEEKFGRLVDISEVLYLEGTCFFVQFVFGS